MRNPSRSGGSPRIGMLTRTTRTRRAPSTPMSVNAAAMTSIAGGARCSRNTSTTAKPTTSSDDKPRAVNPVHPSTGRRGPRRPATSVAIGSPASARAPTQASPRPSSDVPAARCVPT